MKCARSSRLGMTWGNGGGLEGCPQVKRALPTVLWGGLSGFGGGGPGPAVPAGVGFEGGGAEGFEPGEQFAQPPVVVDPGLVVVLLIGAQPPADGSGGDLAGPLPVGAVQAGGGRGGGAGGGAAGGGGAGGGGRAG